LLAKEIDNLALAWTAKLLEPSGTGGLRIHSQKLLYLFLGESVMGLLVLNVNDVKGFGCDVLTSSLSSSKGMRRNTVST
jgi:hypothetical protein